MEVLNQVHNRNLVEWAKDKPEVLVFSGDLTGSTEISLFKKTYPDRFMSMGLGEQNMLSWAGGMAREGFTPFLHTFAVFLYRRPYDQLAMSVAYPNQRVRIFGFLPGITTPGGVTHQAIEDVAVIRGLPNMTILEVGDATEVETVLDAAQAVDGPVYIRMLRGEIPRLFAKNQPFVIDQVRVINEGKDITLFSTGICTEEAMRAIKRLEEKGVSIRHIHVSTLKPFNDPVILQSIQRAEKGVITMENHSVIGGLGSCVAEVMAANGGGKKLVRVGLQDTFAHGSSKNYLMKKYKLDAMALVEQVESLLGKSFNITEEGLEAVRLETTTSLSPDQLEAL